MIDSFRIPDYLDWIGKVAEGRAVVPATAERPEGSWLALQHDVDLNLEWATKVAADEADRGFRACYYVQVGCSFYDVTTADASIALHRLRTMGHEVGLHYDWRRYEHMKLPIDDGLKRDLDLLSICCGHRVTVVCAHMPLRNGTPFHGFDTPQTPGEVYVSDSARGFRDSGLKALADPPERLRFNMHPCWWQATPSRFDIVRRAGSDAILRITKEMSEWQEIDQHPNATDQDSRTCT